MGATGYQTIFGVGLQSAYSAPVAVTDRIPIFKESLSHTIQQIEDEILRGTPGRRSLVGAGQLLPEEVAGSLETDVRYVQKSGAYFHGVDLLMGVAMGAAVHHGAYQWSLLLANSLTKPLTLAFNKGATVWELAGTYIEEFSFSLASGQSLRTSFNVRGHKLRYTGDLGIANTLSNLTSLAAKTAQRVLCPDLHFYIGDLADALGSADELDVADAKLSLKNNLTGSEYSTPDNATSYFTPHLTIEPDRNGKRDVTLEFTVPRLVSSGTSGWGYQLRAWKNAHTPLQILMESSVDSAGRKFRALGPCVILDDVTDGTEGAGPYAIKCKARFYRGASKNNTFMKLLDGATNVVDELAIEFKNSVNSEGRTVAPL